MTPRPCADARDRFAAYLDERLSSSDRRAVREHLEACVSCRREASAKDPAFLFAFAFANPDETSPEETARVLAAVRTGIELKRAERRVSGAAPGALGKAASVAAAAIVAVVVGAQSRQTRQTVQPAAPASVSAAAAPVFEGVRASEASEAGAPFSSAAAPFAEASGPVKGRKLPADATIYDWNPGGGEPRVVWIVDRSLDI